MGMGLRQGPQLGPRVPLLRLQELLQQAEAGRVRPPGEQGAQLLLGPVRLPVLQVGPGQGQGALVAPQAGRQAQVVQPREAGVRRRLDSRLLQASPLLQEAGARVAGLHRVGRVGDGLAQQLVRLRQGAGLPGQAAQEQLETPVKGLELQPFHGGLKLLLGRLAWESGSLAEADELLGEAVSNAPDSMEARYARARFLEERGRLEEAAVEAAAHARLSRLDDLGLPAGLGRDERSLALARAYLEDGEPDRAEEELRALLARGADPAGFRLLQELLEAQERDAGAELRALAEAHPHLRGLEARR